MLEKEAQSFLPILITASVTFLSLCIFISVLIVLFAKKFRQKQADLFSAVLESQEKERERIGKDLHDEMGLLLSAAKLHLELLKYPDTREERLIPEIQKLLDDSITGIRNSVQALVPATLHHFGLKAAVKELCHKLETKHCQIAMSFDDFKMEPGPTSRLNLYRIFQELANNAIKHSGCSRIEVSFINLGAQYLLKVEDNGIGLQRESFNASKGIGLKNIQSRANILGGKVIVNSEANKGTKVEIMFHADKLQK